MAETTRLPGAGLIRDEKFGTWSGERYLNEVLLPAYTALEPEQKLRVDLDGTSGYGPSFIREAFKGLVLKTKDRDILQKLEIVLESDPYRKENLIDFIKAGIKEIK